jgi:hypothetical protein
MISLSDCRIDIYLEACLCEDLHRNCMWIWVDKKVDHYVVSVNRFSNSELDPWREAVYSIEVSTKDFFHKTDLWDRVLEEIRLVSIFLS